MNKIIIDKNDIIDLDNKIVLKKEDKYQINIMKNTSLYIEINNDNNLILDFNINKNVKLKLYIIKKCSNNTIYEHYVLEKNSKLDVDKFNDVNNINENVTIDLIKENAICNYNFKTISKTKENYNLIINHNSKNTISLIKNNGVNIEKGELLFNVSCYIKKGNNKCITNQNNRIINETNNRCLILPNLFISENDIEASHSAYIGTLKENEIFYLESRGISKNEAKKLLIKGYLLSNIDKCILSKVNSIIDKYWR